MTLYDNVLTSIKHNKQRRLKGDVIAIPWVNLPKLAKVLPGVMKENYVIISANQKVGKTQLADYLYLYSPIDWLYEHGTEAIDLDILYFSLEMSKEAKMRQAMSYRLYRQYGVVVSPQKLQSKFDDYILPDEIEEMIEAEQDWFKFFQSKVTFYDGIRNPYGIYLTVRGKCEQEGEYTWGTMDWHREDGSVVEKSYREKYHDNPKKIQTVIVDHARLLSPEKGDTLYDSISKLSSHYFLEMRDMWKCQVVLVQQQAPTSESQQYTMIGGTILDKIRPTADNLGDNKSTGQDANLMLSLFHPQRYNQKQYHDIDLKQMNKAYRELMINFNRDGEADLTLDLYFNGACNVFEEIDHKNIESLYKRIKSNK